MDMNFRQFVGTLRAFHPDISKKLADIYDDVYEGELLRKFCRKSKKSDVAVRPHIWIWVIVQGFSERRKNMEKALWNEVEREMRQNYG